MLVLLSGMAVSPLAAKLAAAQESARQLRPNDAIRITVWGQPTLSGEFVLGENGTIQHPLYQAVTATGVPLSEVTQRVRTFLQRYETEPRFLVEPLFRVYVGGSVRLPNPYLLRTDATIGEAVAQAGGPTEIGRLDRVVVHRNGRQVVVDLTESEGATQRIQSGDQILVDRRRNILQDYIGPTASVLAALGSLFVLFFGSPGGDGAQ